MTNVSKSRNGKPLDTKPPEMGDCVFFKVAKRESHRRAADMKFKGHGFGVFLGHVPPFMPDPDPMQLLRMMGQIGFMTFDDVATFLGDEQAAKCVKAFEDKYYGQEAQDAAPDVPTSPIAAVEGSRLVDSSGTPLKAVPNEEPSDEVQH